MREGARVGGAGGEVEGRGARGSWGVGGGGGEDWSGGGGDGGGGGGGELVSLLFLEARQVPSRGEGGRREDAWLEGWLHASSPGRGGAYGRAEGVFGGMGG